MHCTASGKLFLAMMPAARRGALIGGLKLRAMTQHTITDAAALDAECLGIAAQGHAFNSEESIDGLLAVAVPVFGETARQVLAAVAVHAPTTQLQPRRRHGGAAGSARGGRPFGPIAVAAAPRRGRRYAARSHVTQGHPMLKVHHLNESRSQRISGSWRSWVCLTRSSAHPRSADAPRAARADRRASAGQVAGDRGRRAGGSNPARSSTTSFAATPAAGWRPLRQRRLRRLPAVAALCRGLGHAAAAAQHVCRPPGRGRRAAAPAHPGRDRQPPGVCPTTWQGASSSSVTP